MRKDRDSLGYVDVPDGSLYGPESARAFLNFPYHIAMDKKIIKHIITVKKAYVKAFNDFNKIDRKIAQSIIKACDTLLENFPENEFVVSFIQAGAGTSTNMNTNEVIANKALKISGYNYGEYHYISPHNHVNIGQSSNDVFPGAMKITFVEEIKSLIPLVDNLIYALNVLSTKYEKTVKIGRTHLQDASPITFGLEFRAYSTDIKKHKKDLEYIMEKLKILNFGGSAVGTGVNIPREILQKVYQYLNEEYKEVYSMPPDFVSEEMFPTDFNHLAEWFSSFSNTLIKISRDLRLMSSGPAGGFYDITLPAVQPGSSIMPGKVNPSIPEAITMAAFYIKGMAFIVDYAASNGEMEINIFTPIIYHSIMESFKTLETSINILIDKALNGIVVNEKHVKEVLYRSPGVALVLNPYIGYEKTAEIVKESLEKDIPIITLLKDKKILPEDLIDKIFSNLDLGK
ncbi:MAG: lyase family protein [Thermoplasmata archaeon]